MADFPTAPPPSMTTVLCVCEVVWQRGENGETKRKKKRLWLESQRTLVFARARPRNLAHKLENGFSDVFARLCRCFKERRLVLRSQGRTLTRRHLTVVRQVQLLLCRMSSSLQ